MIYMKKTIQPQSQKPFFKQIRYSEVRNHFVKKWWSITTLLRKCFGENNFSGDTHFCCVDIVLSGRISCRKLKMYVIRTWILLETINEISNIIRLEDILFYCATNISTFFMNNNLLSFYLSGKGRRIQVSTFLYLISIPSNAENAIDWDFSLD